MKSSRSTPRPVKQQNTLSGTSVESIIKMKIQQSVATRLSVDDQHQQLETNRGSMFISNSIIDSMIDAVAQRERNKQLAKMILPTASRRAVGKLSSVVGYLSSTQPDRRFDDIILKDEQNLSSILGPQKNAARWAQLEACNDFASAGVDCVAQPSNYKKIFRRKPERKCTSPPSVLRKQGTKRMASGSQSGILSSLKHSNRDLMNEKSSSRAREDPQIAVIPTPPIDYKDGVDEQFIWLQRVRLTKIAENRELNALMAKKRNRKIQQRILSEQTPRKEDEIQEMTGVNHLKPTLFDLHGRIDVHPPNFDKIPKVLQDQTAVKVQEGVFQNPTPGSGHGGRSIKSANQSVVNFEQVDQDVPLSSQLTEDLKNQQSESNLNIKDHIKMDFGVKLKEDEFEAKGPDFNDKLKSASGLTKYSKHEYERKFSDKAQLHHRRVHLLQIHGRQTSDHIETGLTSNSSSRMNIINVKKMMSSNKVRTTSNPSLQKSVISKLSNLNRSRISCLSSTAIDELKITQSNTAFNKVTKSDLSHVFMNRRNNSSPRRGSNGRNWPQSGTRRDLVSRNKSQFELQNQRMIQSRMSQGTNAIEYQGLGNMANSMLHRTYIEQSRGNTALIDKFKEQIPEFADKNLASQRLGSNLGTRTKHQRLLQKKLAIVAGGSGSRQGSRCAARTAQTWFTNY